MHIEPWMNLNQGTCQSSAGAIGLHASQIAGDANRHIRKHDASSVKDICTEHCAMNAEMMKKGTAKLSHQCNASMSSALDE